MDVLFIFWMMFVVIYFIWKFWQRGVDLSETNARLSTAVNSDAVKQELINSYYANNVEMKNHIYNMESQKDYWFKEYLSLRDTIDTIESYIYDNNLEETPSGKHIIDIINGDADE